MLRGGGDRPVDHLPWLETGPVAGQELTAQVLNSRTLDGTLGCYACAWS
jgi:hypothetical protein